MTSLTVSAAGESTTITYGSNLPVGPNFTRYAAVGKSFKQAMAAVSSSGTITFDPGPVIVGSDFRDGYIDCLRIGGAGFVQCASLYGSGRTATVLQMAPGSNTRTKAEVEPDSNQARVISIAGTAAAPITNVAIQHLGIVGTPQTDPSTGQPLPYNGLTIAYARNAIVNDVDIVGAGPGYASEPPGETFGLGTNWTTGTKITDTLIDGNQNGKQVGATNFGFNNDTGLILTRCTSINGRPGNPGFTWYRCAGATTTDCVSTGNVFNYEQCTGTFTNTRAKITGTGPVHAQIAALTGSFKVQFIEPTWDGGDNGCFGVMIPDNYGSGNAVNPADVTVIKNGVTLTMFDTSKGGTPDPTKNWCRFH